jgi:hypothetical protein
MFVQGYGIGFLRDPRVALHPDPNTWSSVTISPLHTPIQSFKLPHQGGKLTELTYLVSLKHNGRQELRYSPPLDFSVPYTQYWIFWNFLGQKIFFGHFWTLLHWTRILNINTKKWKNIFLDTPYLIYIKFFQNFGSQKIFFESFWTLLHWVRILNINTKKWKNIFLGTVQGYV